MPVTLSAVVPATDRPPTLDRCVAAIRAALDPPDEVVVVRHARAPGPAAARNAGAAEASGDVLAFVDADVVPEPDAFRRIRAAFDADPELVGVFGSYDDAPEAPNVVSGFRNLLHHHVHQTSARNATTFWAGLGAIRRDAFLTAGGFDADAYLEASIEDIELGARLVREGARIRLEPAIQGTHLKSWTLRQMVATDFHRRAVPWVELIARGDASPSALNLSSRHRLSAAASLAAALALLAGRPRASAASVAALVALNASFYALLAHRRGPAQAVAAVPLHALHHLTGVAAVPVGLARGRARRRGAAPRRRPPRGTPAPC
jgi:GT2 family glycosyltransferase